MLEFLDNYLYNISQTPKEYHQGLTQATIISRWEDTTQLYVVKEQKAYPFTEEYEEYEAWVDTVSDDLINTSKVYSDFVKILFKDLDHSQNYKGQYYKLKLDDEHEEYYICYDRMNKLTQVSDFKCVRCNNVLTWLDENGNILKFPCYLGTDISSTNNQISKDGIVPNSRMIILVQANEYTKSIVQNQRFLFENSSAFKVEETNNYMQEQGTNGQVTAIKMYVGYSPITPYDNLELNICDYYSTDYKLKINQNNIKQKKDFNGTLTATITNNNEIVNLPLIWESDNYDIVSIDDDGNYSILGSKGQVAKITCYMENNRDIKDTITITIVDDYLSEKVIITNPNDIVEILEDETIFISCGVYIEGELQSDVISCTASGANQKCYNIKETIDGFYITNKAFSKTPLKLTFSASGCDNKIMNIKLSNLI